MRILIEECKKTKQKDMMYAKSRNQSLHSGKFFCYASWKVKLSIRQSHHTYISEIVAWTLNGSPKEDR